MALTIIKAEIVHTNLCFPITALRPTTLLTYRRLNTAELSQLKTGTGWMIISTTKGLQNRINLTQGISITTNQAKDTQIILKENRIGAKRTDP